MKAERFQARIDLAAVVSIGALALALGACGDEQPGSAAEGVARPAVHLTHAPTVGRLPLRSAASLTKRNSKRAANGGRFRL